MKLRQAVKYQTRNLYISERNWRFDHNHHLPSAILHSVQLDAHFHGVQVRSYLYIASLVIVRLRDININR